VTAFFIIRCNSVIIKEHTPAVMANPFAHPQYPPLGE